MSKTFTLLIWEQIPEETLIYLIPNEDVDPELLKIVHKANGQIANIDEVAVEAEVISCATLDPKYKLPELGTELEVWNPEWGCVLHQFKLDTVSQAKLDQPATITHIIQSGFFL